MKAKKPNAELVWKQLEDLLAPRLRLSVIERTVYAHLLRHSRLEGKLRLQFSIMGRGTQYPSIRRSGAQGRAPPRRPGRFAHDPAQQNRARGGGAPARRDSRRRAEPQRKPGRRQRRKHRHPRAGESRGRGLHEEQAVAQLHPRARARAMFLLLAPHPALGPVPGPRRAASAVGAQFLSQPGLQLHGMQHPERGNRRRRFSPPPLPRAPPDRLRTRRPPPRTRRPRLRQAPPFPSETSIISTANKRRSRELEPENI